MKLPQWIKPKKGKEIQDLTHYGLVGAATLVYWPMGMVLFNSNLIYTTIGFYVVFYIADKMAHKILNVD